MALDSGLDISIPTVEGMHTKHGSIKVGKRLTDLELRGNRVLVERIDLEKTRGNIFIPETAKSRGGTVRAIVRAAGPGRPASEAVKAAIIKLAGPEALDIEALADLCEPMSLAVGDEVVIEPYLGIDLTLETEVPVVEDDPLSPDHGKPTGRTKVVDLTFLVYTEDQILAVFKRAA